MRAMMVAAFAAARSRWRECASGAALTTRPDCLKKNVKGAGGQRMDLTMDHETLLEFRPDDKGRFDEIVARKPDMVHVETMTGKSVYIGFYWDDGRYCQLWISSDKKLSYHHEDGVRRAAQGTEARRAETALAGSVHDGPVGEADAPTLSHP